MVEGNNDQTQRENGKSQKIPDDIEICQGLIVSGIGKQKKCTLDSK